MKIDVRHRPTKHLKLLNLVAVFASLLLLALGAISCSQPESKLNRTAEANVPPSGLADPGKATRANLESGFTRQKTIDEALLDGTKREDQGAKNGVRAAGELESVDRLELERAELDRADSERAAAARIQVLREEYLIAQKNADQPSADQKKTEDEEVKRKLEQSLLEARALQEENRLLKDRAILYARARAETVREKVQTSSIENSKAADVPQRGAIRSNEPIIIVADPPTSPEAPVVASTATAVTTVKPVSPLAPVAPVANTVAIAPAKPASAASSVIPPTPPVVPIAEPKASAPVDIPAAPTVSKPKLDDQKAAFIAHVLPLIKNANAPILDARTYLKALIDRVEAARINGILDSKSKDPVASGEKAAQAALTDKDKVFLKEIQTSYQLSPQATYDSMLARVNAVPPTLLLTLLALESNWGAKGLPTQEDVNRRVLLINTDNSSKLKKFRSSRELLTRAEMRLDSTVLARDFVAPFSSNPGEFMPTWSLIKLLTSDSALIEDNKRPDAETLPSAKIKIRK